MFADVGPPVPEPPVPEPPVPATFISEPVDSETPAQHAPADEAAVAERARDLEAARAVHQRTFWQGVALRLFGYPLLTYLLVMILAMFMEESLIFFPAKYPEGDWTPAGLEFEDAWFEAADGTKLHGWFVPHPSARLSVLYAHGNAGHLAHRAELLEQWHALGVNVLIFDYRGYGRSEGRPNESGVLQDARAARAWLAKRVNIAEKDVVLFGSSLGGGVMTDLAAKDGARALVLQSTFTSLPDVAAVHYPYLPAQLVMRNRLDSLSKIGQYRGPLFQSHGDRDDVIPFSLGQKLFAAANEPKRFHRRPGAGHDEGFDRAYFDALRKFLDELP